MMSTKAYAVVYFTKEDMYSEIPTSWLLNNEAGYWPRSMNAWKLMQKGMEPDKENWEVHQLRIVGYSATLDSARKKAADSEYSTGNEEMQDAGRGRRRKIPTDRIKDFVGISSDEEDEMTPPPSPKLKNIRQTILSNSQKTINSTDEANSDNEVFAEGVICGAQNKTVCGSIEQPQTKCHKMKTLETLTLNKNSFDRNETPTPPSPNQNSHPEKQINNSEDVSGATITLQTLYQEIVKLRSICLSNKKYLSTIYTKVNEFGHQSNNSYIQKLKNLPMKTLDEIQEFELQIEQDDNVKTSLAHLFKSLGGRDGNDHLYRCLVQLFTNELSIQCSLFGQRGNYKMKDLNVIKILTERSANVSNCNAQIKSPKAQ